MDSGDAGDLTLAFELDALRAFANPEQVIGDARTWTGSMGIVADESTPVVTKFARDHGFNPDFFPGSGNKRESLQKVAVQPEHDADRYVVIGTDESVREFAQRVGWEYLPVEEAAEAAEWELATDEDEEEDDGQREGWP